YEVFISHRGPDTKVSFVDSLNQELKRQQVHCFFDKEELQPGQGIPSQLLRAQRVANIYVIVFSPKFEESTWCNIEVLEAVKAMEMQPDCKIIYPVFHGVNPGVVRHGYRDSFAALTAKGRATAEEVQEWIAAFTTVSMISGVDLNELNDDPSENGYVDSEGRVAGILSRFRKSGQMVTSVGITGQGAIGKTRLAKEVFNRIQGNFEASCFVRVR
ncbi:hypothetical protein SELMODRAFT_131977, partial [Selaginella moellendorffii]